MLARKTVIAVVLVFFTDPFLQSFAAVFVMTMARILQTPCAQPDRGILIPAQCIAMP